jgi:hypothetical protein
MNFMALAALAPDPAVLAMDLSALVLAVQA